MKYRILKMAVMIGLVASSSLAVAEGKFVYKQPLRGVNASPTFGMTVSEKEIYEYEKNLNRTISNLSYSNPVYNSSLDRCDTNISIKTDDPNMDISFSSNNGELGSNNIKTNGVGNGNTNFWSNNVSSIITANLNDWDSKSVTIDFSNCKIAQANYKQVKQDKAMCLNQSISHNINVNHGTRYNSTNRWHRKSSDTLATWVLNNGKSISCANTYNTATSCSKTIDGIPYVFTRGAEKTTWSGSGKRSHYYEVRLSSRESVKSTNYDWCVANGYPTAN